MVLHPLNSILTSLSLHTAPASTSSAYLFVRFCASFLLTSFLSSVYIRLLHNGDSSTHLQSIRYAIVSSRRRAYPPYRRTGTTKDPCWALRASAHCSDFAARVSSPFLRRTRMRIGRAGKWFSPGMVGATILCISFCTFFCTVADAQQLDQNVRQPFDQKLFSEMRWRCIGPFRGGRAVAVSGVPHQPNIFYMAAVNGGVWKTTDFGNTWNPIFDDQPTGSVGALAVAPSDPNIIYVGSGEGL